MSFVHNKLPLIVQYRVKLLVVSGVLITRLKYFCSNQKGKNFILT